MRISVIYVVMAGIALLLASLRNKKSRRKMQKSILRRG